jgi:hypothetical protein
MGRGVLKILEGWEEVGESFREWTRDILILHEEISRLGLEDGFLPSKQLRTREDGKPTSLVLDFND